MSKLTITIADGLDAGKTRPVLPGDSAIDITKDDVCGVVVRLKGDVWAMYRRVGEPVFEEDGSAKQEVEQVYGPADTLARHLAATALGAIRNRDKPGSIFEQCNK